MVTILYHSNTNGVVAKRIAEGHPEITTLCDKNPLPPITGTLLRWDSKAQCEATRDINPAEKVARSRLKGVSRRLLGDLCPPTWFTRKDCQFPCVVRPKRHSQGKMFYLCNNEGGLVAACTACGKGWYATKFIAPRKEYRVYVLDGKVWKIIRRFREDENYNVPWNGHADGDVIRVRRESWPEYLLAPAISAMKLLELGHGAVDFVVTETNEPYVLEVNTAPGLKQEKTLKKLAGELIKYDNRPTL